MIINFLNRLLWLVALLALQALVLDHVVVGGIATAMATPWLVMMMPEGTGRVQAQLWAFALGLASDMLAGTPGLSAAAMTLAGLAQPPVLRAFTPKDAVEGFTPSFSTLGTCGYTRYALTLLSLHHLLYYTLEVLSLSRLLESGTSALTSLALSLIVILCLERLRQRP